MEQIKPLLIGQAIGDIIGGQNSGMTSRGTGLLDWDGTLSGDPIEYSWHFKMSYLLASELASSGAHIPENLANIYRESFSTIRSETTDPIVHVDVFSALRCAVLGAFYGKEVYRNTVSLPRSKAVIQEVNITSAHVEARAGGIVIASFISSALKRESFLSTLETALCAVKDALGTPCIVTEKLEFLFYKLYEGKNTYLFENPVTSQYLMGTGNHISETIARAYLAVYVSESFEDAITVATRAGMYTDHVVPLVGAIAGTYYGLNGIPDRWLEKIQMRKEIFELDNCFYMIRKDQ